MQWQGRVVTVGSRTTPISHGIAVIADDTTAHWLIRAGTPCVHTHIDVRQ